MKSITIKEPTMWQLADKIATLEDKFSDMKEAIDVHGKTLLDIGDALEASSKMFTYHNKAIKALEKKCKIN